MSEYTTIRLSEELLRRARRKAAAAGHTLISLIEEGLRIVVAGRTKRELAARSPPRISAAAGSLLPDIDLTAPARLQESEDLAYPGRMKRIT